MNEEEIIKNIKEMIQWSDHNTYKIALQGLLDLYNKEKERNKDLEQILELTSKSLDNISYDQIPIAIEELKFKLQDLEEIEQEHKKENGRLREENEVLRYGLRENKILRHGLEENTEEIDKLYKIINLMAEHIEKGCDFDNRIQTKQQILEYFTNKVEEDIKE